MMEEAMEETKECPQCHRPMRVRHRRSDGQPFWGCTGFATEECRYAENYVKGGAGGSAETDSSVAETKECPLCHRPMRVRHRRSDGQPFWGCTGYASGDCRHAEDYTEETS